MTGRPRLPGIEECRPVGAARRRFEAACYPRGGCATMSPMKAPNPLRSRARRIVGRLAPVGIRPRFLDKLEQHGVRVDPSLFVPRPDQATSAA